MTDEDKQQALADGYPLGIVIGVVEKTNRAIVGKEQVSVTAIIDKEGTLLYAHLHDGNGGSKEIYEGRNFLDACLAVLAAPKMARSPLAVA